MPVRVLLLDDDLAFATEARAAFTASGCEVEVLRDGEAAVASAAARCPDVVIASAELPGINGFRLCSRLKKDHADLAVVLTFADVSASGVASHQRLVSHADAYVPRNVAIHELVTRVRALGKRARAESPTSSRRRSGSPSTRPRSKTPRPGTVAPAPARAASVPPARAAQPARTPPPPPLPPAPPRPAAATTEAAASRVAGPPRPDPAAAGHRDAMRRVADAARAERDEVQRALEAARVDADALRRAADTALRERETAAREREESARELARVRAEVEALTLDHAAIRADRDDKLREVEASRSRIARLEQQVIEVEREMYGASSERVDQRLLVMQRAADASRSERDEARRELEDTRVLLTAAESALADAIAAREKAESQRALDVSASELMDADPSTVEGRIAALEEKMRREHALEMTRLRGEHAAVVFQLRHELAAMRGAARASLPSLSGAARSTPIPGIHAARGDAGDDRPSGERLSGREQEQEDAMQLIRDRHERELAAMRANLDVAIRRAEALEKQLSDASGSGEHPSLSSPRASSDRTSGKGR